MKLKNTPLASLICLSLLGSAALSQADVIISDNFSYGDGGLNMQSGGTGWGSNVWFSANASVSGGVAVGSQGAWDQAQKRNFASTLGDSATANLTNILWVRFDWGHSATVGAGSGYGGLTFYTGTADGGSENFLIGNPWWSTSADTEWTISGGSGDNYTGISNGGMKSGVAKFDLGAGTVSLWVGATGTTIDVGGTADASVSGVSLAGIKGIRILGYNGSASQSFDNLTIATTMAEVDATDVPPAPPTSGTWTNTSGGTWNTVGNWSGNIVATGSGSTADFNTLNIPADTTVNLDSSRTIGNLVFGDTDTSSAASWTLTGSALTLAGTTPNITVNPLGGTKAVTISAAVYGTAGLTKSGDGMLILTGANSYSGTTTISGGTLQIGNGGTTGTVGDGAVTNDGSFVINRSNDLSISSAITGSGSLTKQGAGTLTLGQYPTNTGGITVSGGKITVNAPYWGGWFTNDLHISNGTLEINAPNLNELRINAGNGVYFDAPGGGILALDNETNFFTNGGSLYFSAAGGAQNQITGSGINTDFAAGSTTFNVVGGDDPVSDLKVACGINNSGSITKSGDGILELAASNSYTGNTTVSDGTLLVSGSLRFRPTNSGVTNALSGTSSATLSYLGTVNLDLSAAETIDGNFWTLVNVGSFSSSTLTPAAVTSTLGAFIETPVDSGTWELSTPTAKWTFTEGDGSLTYTVTATDYDIWAGSGGYNLIQGSTGDDDGDGVTNHEEYAFGLIPNSGASVNPITAPLNKDAKTFSYQRRDNDLTGLAYSVWYSTDLSAWYEDIDATQPDGTPDSNGVETINVTLSTLPGNPLPAKLFIQVRAN